MEGRSWVLEGLSADYQPMDAALQSLLNEMMTWMDGCEAEPRQAGLVSWFKLELRKRKTCGPGYVICECAVLFVGDH